MKTKVILALAVIVIAFVISCEKEVNIFTPKDKPCIHGDTTIIIYQYSDIRVEFIETDNPTENCKYGQITFTVYKGDSVFNSTSYCKESDSVIVIRDSIVIIKDPDTSYVCPDNWEYVEYDEEGACDTLYKYDCNGVLDVAIPFCKPLPPDTVVVILLGDTIRIYDTIQITDELAYVVFPLLYEDCDKGSSPYYHNVLGWTVLNTGFSINPYFDDFSENEHGAIVFHYATEKDSGIMWTYYLSSPECIGELPNLYAARIYSGSRIESKQEFWVMYENGEIEKIKSGTTRMTSDFEWSEHYNDDTWDKENLFSFKENDLRNPKAPGIIKLGLGYKRTSDEPILCRNDKYNADELRIWGYKLIPNKKK